MVYTVTSPLKLAHGKKGWLINLNVYRISHYRTLNTTKIKYKKLLQEQIQKLPPFTKVQITFVLYPKTKRLCDVSNMCTIHDKYFCDALVEFGKLPDDNYLYVPEVTYRIGCVDKNNPRVEILIKEIE